MNLEKTRRWAERSGPATIEAQIPGAIRVGNFARARLLQKVLDDKVARREARAARALRPIRETRLCMPWHSLAAEVATRHGVCVKEMLSGWRTVRLREARFEFWHRLHHERGIALAEIGRRTGGYDHTSIRHGVRQWAARIEQESARG